jgi:hypothetical protein
MLLDEIFCGRSLTRRYDRLYLLHRTRGLPDFAVALVEAYDLSAEDIRNAHDLYGQFNAVLKMTNYGSITTAAHEAAGSIGAEAFGLGDLLSRLNRK